MSDTAESQARAQVASVVAMVAALNVDYDRLEELREAFAEFEGDEKAAAELGKSEWPSDCTTHVGGDLIEAYDTGRALAELESAAGDNTSEDEAREAILEDALSVEVRSDWTSVQALAEVGASEFRIVLCTGGPHVELQGELSQGAPSNISVHYRDWGTSGEYIPDTKEREALETYCAQFYFGE